MLLQREWQLEGVIGTIVDNPEREAQCGHSIKWMCTYCGNSYARMTAFKDYNPQPFSFIHGCCPFCVGNRFFPSGSIECLSLVGWNVPIEVLLYQLHIELNFYDSSAHPRKELESC